MRISDWSSDVCSSDLDMHLLRIGQQLAGGGHHFVWRLALRGLARRLHRLLEVLATAIAEIDGHCDRHGRSAVRERLRRLGRRTRRRQQRSEEHTSELQSLMRISYAVFCLTKNNSL